MIHKWLESNWKFITTQFGSNKVAHAYLLNGASGIGKMDFARVFANFALCEGDKEHLGFGCGRCKQCKLVEAGTHPDLKIIQPEEGSSVLKVDSIRSMVDFFEQSSMQAGKKIAVIEPAEALNINAANALLKTLEEPSGDSLILLVSHNSGQLLPTIRSRCQVLDLPIPNREVAKSWLTVNCARKGERVSGDEIDIALALASGSPLKAKFYVDNNSYEEHCVMLDEIAGCFKKQTLLSGIAQRWADDLSIVRLQWVLQWVQTIIKLKSSGLENEVKHQAKMFEHLAGVASFHSLFEVYQFILSQLRLLQGTSNPNKALLFEGVLLKVTGIIKKS